MENKINYIESIKISHLWGKYDIEWNLNPDVNILAGINGSGKTTVIDSVYSVMINGGNTTKYINILDRIKINLKNGGLVECNKIEVANEKGEAFPAFFKMKIKSIDINIEMINSFEKELKSAENIQKLSNETVKTDLDWEIYQLQKKYLDYQLNISKKKDIAVEKSENPKEEIAKIRFPQLRFWEMLDELFGETGKKVNQDKNEIAFLLEDAKEIQAHQLSSGEKQLLVILLTVLIQDNKSSVLFMDEPEVSLHIEWQKKLIAFMRELNPNVQIIIATHSPAIIMNGWLDKVFNMSDIMFRNKELA